MTDGRCFHCDCSLLNFEDDAPPSSPARPLNVDHAIPRVAGGPNRADNYLASCESCNKSRQETPLSAADSRRATELWAELDLDSVAVSARQRDDFKGQAVFLCRSCEVHSWHIDGSPGHRACVESLLRGVGGARELDSSGARKVNTQRWESDHFGRLGADSRVGCGRGSEGADCRAVGDLADDGGQGGEIRRAAEV
ncbi:HNH endonuclease [Microbacterium sp. MRS-1]|uniref:HNH endonuclease n=1 Tax=Microbacterium sp. MRS-1 TaxID=1451261 RepID=UPI003FA61038